MARKFLVSIDLGTNELQNAVIQNLPNASEPTGIAGRIYYNTTSNVLKYYNGSSWQTVATSGGTVTSVALSAPDIFSVSGSPVTSSGTLSLSLATQAANKVFAGPSTGSDAAPTFRTLVANDLPSITSAKISDFTEAVQDVAGAAVTAGSGISVVYDDAGAGTITITNSDKGSSQNIFKNIAVSGQSTVVADGNDDTLTFAGSTGLTITTNATSDTVTFTNSGVTSVAGTTNEIEVSGSTGAVTIGLPDNVTVTGDLAINGGDVTSTATTFNLLNSTVTTLNLGGAATTLSIGAGSGNTTVNNNLVVTGNLTVNGTTTTLNTDTLAVEDNVVLLNSNVTGVPAANAGIEVERGDSTNASILWDESVDKWKAGLVGSEATILLSGVATASDITDFNEAAQDTVGGILTDTATIDFTYSDGTPSITADVKLATTSYLSATSGLAVDISSLETKLVTDSFTKKYAVNNGALTSSGGICTWTVTHSLGTKDVTIQVYEVGSPYSQVEVDVEHTSTSVATLKIVSASTISADTYRVVVIG